MDFELTEAQKMLRTTVRQFVNEHMIPLEREVLKNQSSLGPQNKLQMVGEENYKRLEKIGKDQGLWALYVPTKYEGAGLGNMEFYVVTMELGRSFIKFDFGGDVFDIFDIVTDEVKEKYLMPTVREGRLWAFAQTEPNAGADPAGMETTAVKRGNEWVLNGTKMFVSDGDIADYALIMAVTDKGKRAHGISMFIVDRETPTRPGYKVARLVECMGGAISPAEVILDNCTIPETSLVGEENKGFMIAQKFLEIKGRLHHTGWNVGIASRCMDMAAEYAKQRVTFGKPLAERQAIQWMLADAAIEAHGAKLAGYYLAWKADQGGNVRHEAALAKILGDEMVGRAVDRSLQIFGGVGTTNELPIERFYRLVRILRIGGGSMEVMRMFIARNILQGSNRIL